MFEAPSKPVARAMHHRINLIDLMAPPPCPWLYRISQDELIAVKYTINDYIEKVGSDQVLVYIGLQS